MSRLAPWMSLVLMLAALPARADPRQRPNPYPDPHRGLLRVEGPSGASAEVRCGRFREALVVPGEIEAPDGSCVVTVRAPGFETVVRTVDVYRGRVSEVRVGLDAVAPPVRPMAERDFNDLMGTLSRAPFAKDKLQILGAAVSRAWVSTDQAARVLGLLPFDAERLDAARLLVPRLTDPERGFRLADSMTFAKSKEELARILAGEQGRAPVADRYPAEPPRREPPPRHDEPRYDEPRHDEPRPAPAYPGLLPAAQPPMGATDVDDLVRSLKAATFSKDQLNLLRDAARHHRFRTESVRRIVAVFDFGNDKVEAAAILYRKTVDRREFHRVLADLAFESEREALRARMDDIDRAGLEE